MVHVPFSFLMNGSRQGYQGEPFYRRDYEALVGENVVCEGYGNNEIDAEGREIGFGTLRHGTCEVLTSDDPRDPINRAVLAGWNPGAGLEQRPLTGDSGSSCFYDGYNIGVASRGHPDGVWYIRADRFADWAEQLLQQP